MRMNGRQILLITVFAFAVLGSTARSQAIDAIRVASGLPAPIFVTAPPGDYNRLFIMCQGGQVYILKLAGNTLDLTKPYLDISSSIQAGGEQGLLGMAFDPNYASNGKFYLNFTVAGGQFGNGTTHISQFQVDPTDPDKADTSNEKILKTTATPPVFLTFDHPQANHNGGWIGFSPRAGDANNLYIATGDGGNGDDTGTGHAAGGNAQFTGTLLGKMLRVHVDTVAATYSIPSNNPYFASTGNERKEVWLLGLRNPFRDSFDRLTGRMYIGDVGQNTREEVDVQEPTSPGGGQNYGWRDREGNIQNPAYPTPAPTPTPNPPWINPIIDYPRSLPAPTPCTGIAGRTVIGGNVYRGKQIPSLRGTYVFGDYLGTSGCGSKIFSLNYNGTTVSNAQDITSQLFPIPNPPNPNITLANVSGFGEDANGEIYLTDIGNGNIYKVVPVTANVVIDSVAKDPPTGHFFVHVTGVPFKSHTIQGTNSLTQAFSPITTMTAAGDGTFTFDATTLGQSYYRIAYP